MSWPMVALGEITEVVMGQAPPGKACNKDGVGTPFIKAGEFADPFPVVREWTTKPLKIARGGDVLVCVVGATCGKVSRGIDAAIGRSAAAVRPLEPLHSEYLLRFLHSETLRLRQKAQGLAQGVITRNMLNDLEIPLPPLEEQRRIAGILDAADALRRRRREALALLDTLPGAIFAEMFGDPTQNPRRLHTLPLGEFAILERGKSKHRPRNDPQLLGGPHPLVQTGDVANAEGYIERASSSYSDFGLKQSRKWPAGTLCITIAANIADGAILTFPACFPDSVVGCTVREPHHAEFIRVWLMSVKGRIEKVAPAVAQKNINLKILGAVPIIVPPEQEIQKFTAIMQQLRQDRERAVRQMNELETLFASLQSRAFAGEL